MKIVYLGYDILICCLESIRASGHDIQKIYTIPSGDVYDRSESITEFSAKHEIPVSCKRFGKHDIETLLELGCELMVCAGYPHKIPIDSRLPAINIHPALLPYGRGAWPMPVTILKNLPYSGVTIHKISDAYDEGDILSQEAIPVDSGETLITLTEKIQNSAVRLLTDCLMDFDRKYAEAKPQNPSEAEYWPEPSVSDQTIDLNMSSSEIERIIRAFAGYGCYLKTERGMIPMDMPCFRKLLISDREHIEEICAGRCNSALSFEPAAIFCQQKSADLQIYIERDWFVLRKDENDYFFPCGDADRTEVFLRMLLFKGNAFRLDCITSEQKQSLEIKHPELKIGKPQYNSSSGLTEFYIAEYSGKGIQ